MEINGKNVKARIIAYYLPQFHPIPENDLWWGKGFTEWTNVAKAKPLFKGHCQPHIPSELGFYDLRMPEIRQQQADLARDAGIEGFCYWHYWFAPGNELLERPFQEVLKTGEPDFPFCLGWANHDWTSKTWENGKSRIKNTMLKKQTYNVDEYTTHFLEILPAFKDHRYITVDGKPLFVVFDPLSIPNPKQFIEIWQNLAHKNGLNGIHFVGIRHNFQTFTVNSQGKKEYHLLDPDKVPAKIQYETILNSGFDAVNSRGTLRAELKARGLFHRYYTEFLKKIFKIQCVDKYKYKDIIKYLYVNEDREETVYPTLLPNWDRTPRSGKKSIVYFDSTPEHFRQHLKNALEVVQNKKDEHKIVFLQSWNEWGEGNYIEPDIQFGRSYLDVLKEEIEL